MLVVKKKRVVNANKASKRPTSGKGKKPTIIPLPPPKKRRKRINHRDPVNSDRVLKLFLLTRDAESTAKRFRITKSRVYQIVDDYAVKRTKYEWILPKNVIVDKRRNSSLEVIKGRVEGTRLVVMGEVRSKNGGPKKYVCRCTHHPTKRVFVTASQLLSRQVRSCGCLRREYCEEQRDKGRKRAEYIFSLRDDGYSIDEVAEEMGIKPVTVFKIMRRYKDQEKQLA
jgi:hypothetical protein